MPLHSRFPLHPFAFGMIAAIGFAQSAMAEVPSLIGTRTGVTRPDLLGPGAGRVTMSRFPARSVSASAGEMAASAANATATLRNVFILRILG